MALKEHQLQQNNFMGAYEHQKRTDALKYDMAKNERNAAAKDLDHRTKNYLPIPPADFYDTEEIRETVEQDTKALKKKKQELQDEKVLTKQLLKNIQKNKLNIMREYFESDKLSLQRKMAIKSVKDKVEEQAQKIGQAETVIQDQMQTMRRQEKMLTQCKSLLEKVAGGADEKGKRDRMDKKEDN